MNLIFDAAVPFRFRSSLDHIARLTMRLAVLLCLCLFKSSVADPVLRVQLKLTCTVPRSNFSGKVFLMEWDGITADDEITSREFHSPSNHPWEHLIYLTGQDFELDRSLEPYLKIRHNCGQPNGQTKEYRFELPECAGSVDCSYEVEARVGPKNSHWIKNFN